VKRWDAGERGTVEVGKAADLVVLGGDPATKIEAFADIRYTVRAGRVLFEQAN
jgi:imidazolonepropionase-like amidohydrolase